MSDKPITTAEEMREAAIDAVYEADSLELATHGGNKIVDRIRAIPIGSQPVAVTVKPLVWQKHGSNGELWAEGADVDAFYHIKRSNERLIDPSRNGFRVVSEYGVDGYFETIEQAILAANSSLAERILPLVDATPASYVRAAALREAARKVMSDDWSDPHELCENILALIDKEPQP